VVHLLVLATSFACSAAIHAADRFERATAIAYARNVVLEGQRSGTRFQAVIGRESLWLSRSDGAFRQIWLDRDRSSWHWLNGFLGVASPARTYVRRLALSAMNGSIASHAPSSVRCERHHRREYATLVYEAPHDARIFIELDPVTSLPRAVDASNDSFTVKLRDLRYDARSDVPFLIHLNEDNQEFSFDHATFGRTAVPAIPPAKKSPLTETIDLPLIENGNNPKSRGVMSTIAGHRLNLMLDSGDNLTVLSVKAAKRIAAPLSARATDVLTASGFARLPLTIVPNIHIGKLVLKNETVAISADTHGYDGMIGLSLFSLGRVKLEQQKLTISRSLSHAPISSVPIDTYDGLPIASARLGRKPVTVLLDTGAALSAILPARWLRLETSRPIRGERCDLQGASAWQYFTARRYTGFELGTLQVPLAACVASYDEILPDTKYGLLGFPTIFKLVQTFDYRAQYIEVRRRG
jgi:hypothetical protein